MGINQTVTVKVNSSLQNVPFNSDEYLFEGVSQIEGMSGGATINGNGYTGCVHGINMDPSAGHSRNYRVNMAVVIPAHRIFDCIDDLMATTQAFLQPPYLRSSSDVRVLYGVPFVPVGIGSATCATRIVEVPRF